MTQRHLFDDIPYPQKNNSPDSVSRYGKVLLGITLLIFLFVISRFNYLVFHVIAELFSIGVAWSAFILVWNARRYLKNDALLFLGIAYLFIGCIDLCHTLIYKGMGVFNTDLGADPATQLWIAGRYIESISLCIFPLLCNKKIKIHPPALFSLYALVTVLLFCFIFAWDIFPTCYIDGVGLTPFKRYSEYLICLILGTAYLFLRQHKKDIGKPVYPLMKFSLFLTISGELAFTFYVSVYGFSNLVGHYFKIVSFFLIYKAIIETGIKAPYQLLFKEYKENEKALEIANKELKKRLEVAEENARMKDDLIIYRSIVQNATNLVAFVDWHYVYRLVNKIYTVYFNLAEEDIIGKSAPTLMGFKQFESISKPHFDRCLKGELIQYQEWFDTPGKGRRFMDVIYSPVFGNQNQPIGIATNIRDITEQKEAESLIEQNRIKFQAIFDYANDGILVGDAQTKKLTMANQTICDMLGYAEEELLTLSVYDIHPKNDLPKVLDAFEKQLNKETRISSNLPVLRKDGTVFYADINSSPFSLEGRQYLLGIFRDITERLEYEKKMIVTSHALETSISGTAFADLDGYITYTNASFNRLFGYDDKTQLIGKRPGDFLTDPEAEAVILKALDEVGVYSSEIEVRHVDGSNRTLLLNAHIVKSPSGEPICLMGTFIDLTDLYKTKGKFQNVQRMLSEAERLAGVGSWVWDITHDCWTMSENWLKIHGCSTTHLTSKELISIAHPDDKVIIENKFKRAIELREPYNLDHRIIRQDNGEVRHIKAYGDLKRDALGNPNRFFGAALDVTEQKKIEDALILAKNEAQRANDAKTQFLANMSHEIRTPIHSILGFCRMLKDRQIGPLNTEQLTSVHHINESGNRLLVLINDILDLSKVESGIIECQSKPLDLRGVMDHIEYLAYSLVERKQISIKTVLEKNTPHYIMGDQFHIEQVLRNLVSNAAKYTDQGEIIISVGKDCDSFLRFSVQDTGIGIYKNEIEKIFQKFYQRVTDQEKRLDGTGLGLAITKKLVTIMGGEMTVTSTPDEGSCFSFTLPLKIPKPDAIRKIQIEVPPETPEKHPSLERSLKILLAEDDELVQKTTTYFLEREGHIVTSVESGKAVLDILKKERFDIILMDINMPEMNGMEATRQIRDSEKDEIPSDIPIIAMTAYAMTGDRENILDGGMDDYISKPIDYDALLTLIGKRVVKKLTDNPWDIAPEADTTGDEQDYADIQDFIDSTEQDPEFLSTMLSTFPEQIAERLEKIDHAIDNRDIQALRHAAHGFIALFSAIYIRSAAKLGHELQAAARTGDLTNCEHIFYKLKNRINHIKRHIESLSSGDYK